MNVLILVVIIRPDNGVWSTVEILLKGVIL